MHLFNNDSIAYKIFCRKELDVCNKEIGLKNMCLWKNKERLLRNEKKERLAISFMPCSQYHFFAVYFDRKVSCLKPNRMEILAKYNIKNI